MPHRLLVTVAVAIAFSVGSPARVNAQVPGYQQLNPGAVRAEYLAEVLDRVNELLADWGESWASDQVEELTELYAEDAVLLPPDAGLLRGRAAIREYFMNVLPDHGHIEAFMLDFDASGEMSQVFGNYMLGYQGGDSAGTQTSGPMITIYVRRGRSWQIRSQIFVPATP